MVFPSGTNIRFAVATPRRQSHKLYSPQAIWCLLRFYTEIFPSMYSWPVLAYSRALSSVGQRSLATIKRTSNKFHNYELWLISIVWRICGIDVVCRSPHPKTTPWPAKAALWEVWPAQHRSTYGDKYETLSFHNNQQATWTLLTTFIISSIRQFMHGTCVRGLFRHDPPANDMTALRLTTKSLASMPWLA